MSKKRLTENITNLALVRFGLPPATNLSSKLPQALLVLPSQDNSGWHWRLGLDIIWDVDEYGVRKAEFHVEPFPLFCQARRIVLQLSSVADSDQPERENKPFRETLNGVRDESAAEAPS